MAGSFMTAIRADWFIYADYANRIRKAMSALFSLAVAWNTSDHMQILASLCSRVGGSKDSN